MNLFIIYKPTIFDATYEIFQVYKKAGDPLTRVLAESVLPLFQGPLPLWNLSSITDYFKAAIVISSNA